MTAFRDRVEDVDQPGSRSGEHAVVSLLRETVEPLAGVDAGALDALVGRIGDAEVVLLGEATHGTREFYRFRARLTRELVLRRGFRIVAVEADWPDAAHIDHHVRNLPWAPPPGAPFQRFAQWMWRNREVTELAEWLRAFAEEVDDPDRAPVFAGLDLYSTHTSIAAVLAYLGGVDPALAALVRERYAGFARWREPAAYGMAALTGRIASCEGELVAVLRELLERRLELIAHDGERWFDAVQNAAVVRDAERYYRAMVRASHESWNLRDQHMWQTLASLRSFHGPGARAIVWAHNSHVGDASATAMGARGELNIGELARKELGDSAVAVGFGTDHGTVSAAHDWGGAMEVMQVRPARAGSYERLCHDTGIPAFILPLRQPRRTIVRDELAEPRLERAIGVVYRPDTELQSHYFSAVLPVQFDEWVWFDETSEVASVTELAGTRAAPGESG